LVELGSQLEREFGEGRYPLSFISEKRPELYGRVKKANIEYDEQDLQDLALALTIRDSRAPVIKRAFIGALISNLTESRMNHNKRAIVKLDMNNMEFPYLCYGTKYADRLEICNVKGDFIGSGIASCNGKARKIHISNIEGNFAGARIISNCGSAGIIKIENIMGDYAGIYMGDFGSRAGLISINNLIGRGLYYNIVSKKGRAGIISYRKTFPCSVILTDALSVGMGETPIIFSLDLPQAVLKNMPGGKSFLSYIEKERENFGILDFKGMYHDRINEFTDRLENNAQGYISAEDVFLSLCCVA